MALNLLLFNLGKGEVIILLPFIAFVGYIIYLLLKLIKAAIDYLNRH